MKQHILAFTLLTTTALVQAGPVEDALVKIGFTQTNKGINKTVFASFEKNMDISTCNKFIANVATNLGRAPTNIVETNSMRIVRIGPVDFGSMLMTCNGSQMLINLSRNPS